MMLSVVATKLGREREKHRMATEIVAGHIELARVFLGRAKDYLEQDDLHQASEKGWGAASHIVKAIAAANGWEYEHHDQFDTVIANARQRFRQTSMRQYGSAAHSLHRNYYKHTGMLNADTIREDIADVEKMVSVLQPYVS